MIFRNFNIYVSSAANLVHVERLLSEKLRQQFTKVCLFETFCVKICWVRIVQRVGYEMSEPGYESSGY